MTHPKLNPINLDRKFSAEEVCDLMDEMEASATRRRDRAAGVGMFLGIILGALAALLFAA